MILIIQIFLQHSNTKFEPMKTLNSKDDALHFAMKNAQECANLFSRLANDARNSRLKKTFSNYAREEFAQVVSLSRLRQTSHDELPEELFTGIELNGQLNGYHPEDELNYNQILEVAMRKIRLALKLYLEMASRSSDNDLRDVFKSMAVKENSHKLGVEAEYNDSLLLC
ncbi:MAG: hypothetical protein CVT94_03555 [Bacteroidetes bacterium HGW-Bacteroidetes-11]|jgi:rubrerythrin|nr:MAG: hypothetical protein CVT94_03555 [Bacteroidetes bacterium HGW-Bacteroidetes-11]